MPSERQPLYGRPARLVVPGRDVIMTPASPTPPLNEDATHAPAISSREKVVDILVVRKTTVARSEPRQQARSQPRSQPLSKPGATQPQENLQPPQAPVSPSPSPSPSSSSSPSSLQLTSKRAHINNRLVWAARFLWAIDASNKNKNKNKNKRKNKRKKAGHKKYSWRQLLYQGVILILVVVSLYAAVDTWLTNKEIKQEQSKTTAVLQSDDVSERQEAEGKDETPITTNDIKNYKVSAELPRVIRISKIKVEARVLSMGVNKDGSMQAPISAYDAGWYTGSVRPGQLGAAVIVGHASGPTREGLFAYLDTLKAGDKIEIERGDGTKLNYSVVKTETVPLSNVDMNKFLRPADGEREGLNLMTCAGSWVQSSKTRDQRVMVYTKRVE